MICGLHSCIVEVKKKIVRIIEVEDFLHLTIEVTDSKRMRLTIVKSKVHQRHRDNGMDRWSCQR